MELPFASQVNRGCNWSPGRHFVPELPRQEWEKAGGCREREMGESLLRMWNASNSVEHICLSFRTSLHCSSHPVSIAGAFRWICENLCLSFSDHFQHERVSQETDLRAAEPESVSFDQREPRQQWMAWDHPRHCFASSFFSLHRRHKQFCSLVFLPHFTAELGRSRPSS